MKKLILTVLLILLFQNESMAQGPSINDLLESAKKHKDAWHVPAASSQIRNWQVRKGHCADSDYVMLKKVGVLTVYIQDGAEYQYSTSTHSPLIFAKRNLNGIGFYN